MLLARYQTSCRRPTPSAGWCVVKPLSLPRCETTMTFGAQRVIRPSVPLPPAMPPWRLPRCLLCRNHLPSALHFFLSCARFILVIDFIKNNSIGCSPARLRRGTSRVAMTTRAVLAVIRGACLRQRVLQEEPNHLGCGIGPLRKGVGTGAAASRPSMASAMNDPSQGRPQTRRQCVEEL